MLTTGSRQPVGCQPHRPHPQGHEPLISKQNASPSITLSPPLHLCALRPLRFTSARCAPPPLPHQSLFIFFNRSDSAPNSSWAGGSARGGLGFPRAMEAAAAASSASASASGSRSRPSTSAAQVCLPPSLLRCWGFACAGRRAVRVSGRRGNVGRILLPMRRRSLGLGEFGQRSDAFVGSWGTGAGFRGGLLASCLVCAAARAGSGGDVLVFAAVVGGVVTVFLFLETASVLLGLFSETG